MPVLPFGPWIPDDQDFRNRGVTVAENVVPSATGYRPVSDFVATTSALDARPRGAIRAKDKDGNVFEYAGDAAKLYENVSETWTDVSKSGGYSTGTNERWEFQQWKNKVLAVNWNDNPQQITFDAANFSDLTTALRARHITAIRDFVVVANTFDATDGNVPHRVRWSAFNDETDWTVSASTLSDYQDLKLGEINRILGGEFGVVFGSSVWRMTFVGSPVVFQIDEVLPDIKLIAPGAAVRDGSTSYFLSTRGFIALDHGTQATPIGANKVDRFVLDDIDEDFFDRVSAAVEPGSKRILFSYPGADNIDGRPNRIIVYDPSLDKWSIIKQENTLIWQSGGTGETLETLDNFSSSIDTLETPLDSNVWKGTGSTLGMFNKDFKHGFFSGSSKAATIETKEYEFHDGHRTRLNAFRPLVDGGTVTGQVAARNRQSDMSTFGSALTQSSSGRFTTRASGRYHKFRLNMSGDWGHAIGIQIERTEAKKGERRG